MQTLNNAARPAEKTPSTSTPTTSDLSHQSLSVSSATNSLRKMAGVMALSTALANGEPATAQAASTPATTPPQQPQTVAVLQPDGSLVYRQMIIQQGALVPANVQPQIAPQVSPPPQAQAPVTSLGGIPAPGQVPMASNSQGIAPQGQLTVVYPGGLVPQTVQAQPNVVSAPPVVSHQVSTTPPPSVYQAQLEYSAAQMRANPRGNPELDQARLNLQAAQAAEREQRLYFRELQRYNREAERYHNRRADRIGWALDWALPSKVPGPLVPPVPPRGTPY